jgi:hypothetical protein
MSLSGTVKKIFPSKKHTSRRVCDMKQGDWLVDKLFRAAGGMSPDARELRFYATYISERRGCSRLIILAACSVEKKNIIRISAITSSKARFNLISF